MQFKVKLSVKYYLHDPTTCQNPLDISGGGDPLVCKDLKNPEPGLRIAHMAFNWHLPRVKVLDLFSFGLKIVCYKYIKF
jgi:hypothetical protein